MALKHQQRSIGQEYLCCVFGIDTSQTIMAKCGNMKMTSHMAMTWHKHDKK